jgi:WD40 repeat protein/energy-coupling factor transporter ATP-binding protein EcfA2
VARVFVSHAGQDHLLAAELHDWLASNGHGVFLDQDLHDGLALGEDWEQRLYERLRWADAVVCLITSAYCDSAWCAAEVGIARFQGCRLLPLQAEAGCEHPLLMPSRHQYTDWVGDPPRARELLSEALRRMVATGGWDWPAGHPPFPGLRRFDAELQRVFFGRSTEVAALAAQLRSPADTANGGILLVVGPSGCGKSSLLRAGLGPVIDSEPGWLTLSALVPGRDPVATLARELAREAKDVGLGWTYSFARDRLDHVDGLAALSNELLVASDRQQLLCMVDQAEELITVASASARAQFADLLRPALSDSVEIVGTLRSEFLASLLNSPELADIPARTYALRPLPRAALPSVIEGPARLADIRVDPALVAELADDAGNGQALPLLAYALAALAEGVRPGGELSTARYNELGGVRGALIRQADAALAEAMAVNHRTADQVIAGLLRLVWVDDNRHPTRWLVDRDELPAPVLGDLEPFTARRLLTTDMEAGSLMVGVTHEAFLTAWPPLAAAINTHAAALRARRTVELAAIEWDGAGRPSSRLWEGNQLAAAVGATAARIKLVRASDHDPAIDASPEASRPANRQPQLRRVLITESVELSLRGREFMYRSMRRDRSRRMRAITVLAVLLVLALAAAAVAAVQQHNADQQKQLAQEQKQVAQQQQRIATARQLITEASTSLNGDPNEALQLDVAAMTIQNDTETRGTLVSSLISTPYAGVLQAHSDLVGALAFNPAGDLMVSCSDDNTCRLWSYQARKLPTSVGQPFAQGANVNAVAFAPNGKILAVALANGTFGLWSLADPGNPTLIGPPVKAHNGQIRGVAIGNGGIMLTAGEDGFLCVWDISRPNHPIRLGKPLAANQDLLRSLAISPNGKIAATGGTDATIRLWKIDRDHSTPLSPPLRAHGPGMVRAIAFSSDGGRLATASDDHTALVWNVADPRHAVPIGPHLVGHEDEVTSVAFHPQDRNQLITGSDDQTARVWSVAKPAHPVQLVHALSGAHDEIYSVAYTPDATMVAVGVRDGTITFSDLHGVLPAPLGAPLAGHQAGVDPVVISPTGKYAATASEDGTAKIWSVPVGKLITTLGHDDEVTAAAFSPDVSGLFATGSGPKIYLWNLKDPAHPQAIGAPLPGDKEEAVVSLAFCPGRQLLIGGEEGGHVRIWNLADPTRAVLVGRPLIGNADAVDSVACSAHGSLLAVAGTGMIKMWDLAVPDSPRPFDRLEAGHKESINAVRFSPDGRTMAAAGDDGYVILWDVNGTHLTPIGPPFRAHGDPVTSVAFSPDDPQLFASASEDQTAQLWDISDRAQPLRLGPPAAGHQRAVNSVALGPHGTMATSSDDQKAQLWTTGGLDSIKRNPIGRACLRTGRGFSQAEWQREIPGLPYQKTCPG